MNLDTLRESAGSVGHEGQEPLVTAIVSTYNSSAFLPGCLEDLLAQTLAPRLEIVVVDSGSRENDAEIARAFCARFPRLRVLRTERRETIYAAWNRGARAARGRFLYNANTDDRLRPDALERMAGTLLAEPEAGVVYVDQIITAEPNQTYDRHVALRIKERQDFDLAEAVRFNPCGPQVMWRRELHGRIGYFRDDYEVAGDWDFWLRAALDGGCRVRRIPEPLGLYYLNLQGLEHGPRKQAQRQREIGQIRETYAARLERLRGAKPQAPAEAPAAPRLSVLMSARNAGPYLDQAIRSVLDQTYTDFEFLIVDDASEDDSLARIKGYTDPRIVRIEHSYRMGLTRSLRNALAVARGELVARMDADDFCPAHRFQTQIDYLDAHPDCDLVGSAFGIVDEEGRLVRLVDLPHDHEIIAEALPRRNCIAHGSTVFRKAACLRAGGYDPALPYAQDFDLWQRMAETSRLNNISEPLYFWRSSRRCVSNALAEEQARCVEQCLRRGQERRAAKTAPAQQAPLVSVVVPTFNRPDFLARALRSIEAQTWPNIEILVCNDAGQDVGPVIQGLGLQRPLRLADHPRNKGLAAARNTALGLARGEFVAYLDDDDLFYPHHVQTLVQAMQAEGLDAAYSDLYRAHRAPAGEGGAVLWRDVPYSFDFDPEMILWRNLLAVHCLMHRRVCLERVGLFDESLPVHEDWDLWIRLSREHEIRHVREVTCEYDWRMDGTSMTSSRQLQFWRTKIRLFRKHGHLAAGNPRVLLEQQGLLRFCLDRFVFPAREMLAAAGLDLAPGRPTERDACLDYLEELLDRFDLADPAHQAAARRLFNPAAPAA